MKTKLSFYIRVLISVLLLAILIWIMRGKYNMIMEELKNTNMLLFILAFFLFCVTMIVATVRMDIILKGEKIEMSLGNLLELNYIGYFFNNFMPSSVGGDIVKAYYTGVLTGQKAKSYVSVFMDRLIGLFSFAFISLITTLISWKIIPDPTIKNSVILFVAACALLALFCLNAEIAGFLKRLFEKIKYMDIGKKIIKIYNIIHDYRGKKGIMSSTFVVSMLVQIIYFGVIFILFRALNIIISFNTVLIIMPIVSVISMLPSIGGLGLREGAIVALFGPVLGNERAFGVSILLLGILLLTSIIGGIIYLVSPQFKCIKIKEDIKF